MPGAHPPIWAFFLLLYPPTPPPPCPPTRVSPFPRCFLAPRQDRLAYIIREVDAEAWAFRGCVSYFVARLDPPFHFQHMGVCGEKRNAVFMVNVYRIMQEICHLSCGIIARSLSMKTNTDIKTHPEANALIHARPQPCDLPVAFRNDAPASSNSRDKADDARRLK